MILKQEDMKKLTAGYSEEDANRLGLTVQDQIHIEQIKLLNAINNNIRWLALLIIGIFLATRF